jgi:hypothetical protein
VTAAVAESTYRNAEHCFRLAFATDTSIRETSDRAAQTHQVSLVYWFLLSRCQFMYPYLKLIL